MKRVVKGDVKGEDGQKKRSKERDMDTVGIASTTFPRCITRCEGKRPVYNSTFAYLNLFKLGKYQKQFKHVPKPIKPVLGDRRGWKITISPSENETSL